METSQSGAWLSPEANSEPTHPDPLTIALTRMAWELRAASQDFKWSPSVTDAMRNECRLCHRIAHGLSVHQRAAVNSILKSRRYEGVSLLEVLQEVRAW